MHNELKFDPGDVVELKSGGPKMTVESAGCKNAQVAWFNGDHLQRTELSHASLKISGGTTVPSDPGGGIPIGGNTAPDSSPVEPASP